MDWKKLLNPERIRRSAPYDSRNEFESDYGRIIYSPALRRMHDKTQVFPLTTDDNIHSRLTHSNEVMSLGYTFGMLLCDNKKFVDRTGFEKDKLVRIIPIILQNVCLIHDIGNSPFGHFGETIISNYFKKLFIENDKVFKALTPRKKRDFLNYDGNAQGLRVLTKLQILNDPYGLNLTYATLSASLKYPNFEEINKTIKEELLEIGKSLDPEFIENKKHGIFFSEEKYFNLIAENTGLEINGRKVRHPLCYLMEAADSIAYLCMDMEDGFNKGVYSIEFIKSKFAEKQNVKVCDEIYTLLNNEHHNDTYKIVTTRIKLIAYFVDKAFQNFINNIDEIEKGLYNKELIEDDANELYKLVKGFSNEIFKSREINNLESTGYSVIVGLLDFYIDFIFLKNDNSFVSRATALISNSIIDAAIEETLIETCNIKLQKGLKDLTESYNKFIDKEDKSCKKIEKELNNITEKIKTFSELEKKYSRLFKMQIESPISSNSKEYAELSETRAKIYEVVNPSFDDLDIYYKLRVIVDFISGMTDQYALKHYQKISGQRIS